MMADQLNNRSGGTYRKEEESNADLVNGNRFREAMATGKAKFVVSCPFRLTMMLDMAKAEQAVMRIKNVAQGIWSANEHERLARPVVGMTTKIYSNPAMFANTEVYFNNSFCSVCNSWRIVLLYSQTNS